MAMICPLHAPWSLFQKLNSHQVSSYMICYHVYIINKIRRNGIIGFNMFNCFKIIVSKRENLFSYVWLYMLSICLCGIYVYIYNCMCVKMISNPFLYICLYIYIYMVIQVSDFETIFYKQTVNFVNCWKQSYRAY